MTAAVNGNQKIVFSPELAEFLVREANEVSELADRVMDLGEQLVDHIAEERDLWQAKNKLEEILESSLAEVILDEQSRADMGDSDSPLHKVAKTSKLYDSALRVVRSNAMSGMLHEDAEDFFAAEKAHFAAQVDLDVAKSRFSAMKAALVARVASLEALTLAIR